MKRFEILDAQGSVVYTYEHTEQLALDLFPAKAGYTQREVQIPGPPPPPEPVKRYGGARRITKLEFRRLFTLDERMGIDGFAANPKVPPEYRAMFVTLLKDLDLAQEINLDDADTIAGVRLLGQLGVIEPGRVEEILRG